MEHDAKPAESPRYSSAMLGRTTGLFGWFGRRYFDHIRLDHETENRLRALSQEGTIVYVMRTRSTLDYLFFNYLFLRIGMPLARFANGLDLTLFRDLKKWMKSTFHRVFRFGSKDEPKGIEQLTETIQRGKAALLFMKVRALTSERRSNPRFIERLVQIQRGQDEPIMLLPQHISWPRKPPTKRHSWFDIMFGDRLASGRLRKFVHFLRSSKLASARIGEPINLKQVLAEHKDWSDERLARKVRRVLIIHLANEAMAISGPRVKSGPLLRKEILERRKFKSQLQGLARENGLDPVTALETCQRYLKEISANLNFEVLLAFSRALGFVFRRIFNGVEVDEAGMRRVKEAARHSRTAPLILVPSHKSHVDYLVVSWVFMNYEFVPPHIAAGRNLSFFPLGTLFRRSGAFFLRRSFAGLPFYKFTFKNYLWKLVREGYPVEFFMEGGRSRTGKLLPPKMGMLAMLLEGIREGEFKDLQFIPINISYERVLETGSYRHELTGGQKQVESVAGVVKAGRVFRARHGRVYVNFSEPVRLSEYLSQFDIPPLKTLEDARFRETTRRLSYHLMRQIHEATVVAPSALVGAVLLSHHRRGISDTRLRELVGFTVDLLVSRNARLSASLRHVLKAHQSQIDDAYARNARDGARARGDALKPLLSEGVVLLKRMVNTIEQGQEQIYSVPDRSRIELDYYRNSVLSILAPDCLVATALTVGDELISYDSLSAETRRLSYWFRLEFIYETDTTFDVNFRETIDRLISESLIEIDAHGFVRVRSQLAIDFLRGMMLHLVEAYWAAADALRTLVSQPMEKRLWLEFAREHAEKEFLQGDIRRAEAASTVALKNALDLFIAEGLVTQTRVKSGRKTDTFLSIAQDRTPDEIAFRRDDIGAFLIRIGESAARQATTPLPSDAFPMLSDERARETNGSKRDSSTAADDEALETPVSELDQDSSRE
ncbi:MAG: 1-acyl-sn-glycerol-3-phosphate acyltransferase [Myxococcota bacterium]|nr:1-acyl-sn-glycerol-3-phosphate acyltransferase [Myxococcota bacterium]